ncbi:hypothetical protein EVAR_23123_1 [Eumeta japonica]|uniref:Uncharacterized protein n=1 Tax=Eumeta variegata TaxID=151549 RepID=A0A4C1VD53_EUMVA|nr:hypothetical protein EVAR_23123_1 [Eumeta japonica]
MVFSKLIIPNRPAARVGRSGIASPATTFPNKYLRAGIGKKKSRHSPTALRPASARPALAHISNLVFPLLPSHHNRPIRGAVKGEELLVSLALERRTASYRMLVRVASNSIIATKCERRRFDKVKVALVTGPPGTRFDNFETRFDVRRRQKIIATSSAASVSSWGRRRVAGRRGRERCVIVSRDVSGPFTGRAPNAAAAARQSVRLGHGARTSRV